MKVYSTNILNGHDGDVDVHKNAAMGNKNPDKGEYNTC